MGPHLTAVRNELLEFALKKARPAVVGALQEFMKEGG